MADRLKLLVINDEAEKKEPYNALIDIDHVREPEQAQALLLESLRTDRAYDIIACDVNFEKSETVRRFINNNSQDAAVIPLGPILALPFLRSSTTVFVSYSSYWPALRNSPDVQLLATLGMIEAQTRDRIAPLMDIASTLDDEERAESLPGHFKTALAKGLRLFRDRLYSETTRLRSIGILHHRLNCIKEHGVWPPLGLQKSILAYEAGIDLADGPQLHTLLRDEQGVLALDVVRFGQRRALALASLYADFFLSALNPDDLTASLSPEEQWAEGFGRISSDLDSLRHVPGGDIDVFTKEIAKTLKKTDSYAEGWEASYTLQKQLRSNRRVFSELFPGLEEGVLIRACVLCAWTAAWMQYFDDDIQLLQMRPTVKRLLGLLPPEGGDGTVQYRRLFLKDTSSEPKVDREGRVSWAAPFIRGRRQVEGYNLDFDAPADLTAFDRGVCEAYASLSKIDGGLGRSLGGYGARLPAWMTMSN